jgi:hypothetical protein
MRGLPPRNLDKSDSQPSLRDSIGESSSHTPSLEALVAGRVRKRPANGILTSEGGATPFCSMGWENHDGARQTSKQKGTSSPCAGPNLSATGAKTAGFIVGLPESPITSITLSNVHIAAEKGMTISNATVAAHDFTVHAASGASLITLERAQVKEK